MGDRPYGLQGENLVDAGCANDCQVFTTCTWTRVGRPDVQATGQGLNQTTVEKAVALSVEKYCGVHATLAPQVKITWAVEILP